MIHWHDLQVSLGQAVGQERSSNHCQVDKEEVVQALQEAAVQPRGRHAKPVGIPCLVEVGRRVQVD